MSSFEHEVSPRSLFVTWVALMVLGGVSLALRFAHLGGFGFLAMLLIAVVQASLVAFVDMELAFEKPTVRFAFLTALALFSVMMSLMVADVLTRPIPPLANPPGTAPRYHG